MKILMVCLGNICRSPLAEGILKKHAQGTQITIDSAGTSAFHAGENPDERAVRQARKNGVDISRLVGRQFDETDFDRFDKIYVMDAENRKNVLKLARNETDKKKVEMLMNEVFPGSDMEVPDPYFGGDAGFENVYNLLEQAAQKIVEKYG